MLTFVVTPTTARPIPNQSGFFGKIFGVPARAPAMTPVMVPRANVIAMAKGGGGQRGGGQKGGGQKGGGNKGGGS